MLSNYDNEFSIDGPLQKYLLINSLLNNVNQSMYTKIKRYSIICLYIIYILKEIFILLFLKNHWIVKTYLSDFFLVFENSNIYAYSSVVLVTFNAFIIFIFFQYITIII